MPYVQRFCLGLAGLAFLLFLVGLIGSVANLWPIALVVCAAATSVGIGSVSVLAGYQFTMWIATALLTAMFYPAWFLQVGPLDAGAIQFPAIDLRNKWLILVIVQLVMFGMGTKMSLQDFAGIVKMPYPICIGIGLQFLVMPLTGYGLAKLFGFPPEIAAGVVLIGSCSSGLASNVMCYLAGANLALSISLTALATMLAPLATPFWMKQLAGEFIEIDTISMAFQIVKIVLVPIGAAMLHDYLKQLTTHKQRTKSLVSIGVAMCFVLLGCVLYKYPSVLSGWFSPKAVGMFTEGTFMIGGAIGFALIYHVLVAKFNWMEKQAHFLSMAGIIYFTLVTTAAGRDKLLVAGAALVLAAILHNLAGYVFGYGLSRLVGLDKESSLTVAFEVGMQNGGMASGLAGFMGKLGTVGLAAAVFSPWMNISGSILANQIRRSTERRKTDADQSSKRNL